MIDGLVCLNCGYTHVGVLSSMRHVLCDVMHSGTNRKFLRNSSRSFIIDSLKSCGKELWNFRKGFLSNTADWATKVAAASASPGNCLWNQGPAVGLKTTHLCCQLHQQSRCLGQLLSLCKGTWGCVLLSSASCRKRLAGRRLEWMARECHSIHSQTPDFHNDQTFPPNCHMFLDSVPLCILFPLPGMASLNFCW